MAARQPKASPRKEAGEPRRTAFGTALRQARLARRYTQKQLATLMGVDQTSISAWEVGRQPPRYREDVEKLEAFLGPEACPPGTLTAILYGAPSPISAAALSGATLPDDLTEEERETLALTLAVMRARRAAGE